MRKPSIKKAAEDSGLSKNWFEQLANELGITQDVLVQELLAFRARAEPNEDLFNAYPTKRRIEDFHPDSKKKNGNPQSRTIDFVLSFLDQLLPAARPRRLTFEVFGSLLIEGAKKEHKLEFTKALDAEKWRRGGYWQRRDEHIEDVLCGTYVLHRLNSRNEFCREILHFKRSKRLPEVLVGYWRRTARSRSIFYVGNLFISANFMYGTFINKSSDEIIKPVNLSILSKHATAEEVSRQALTGAMTGANRAQDKFFHGPVLIKRVKRAPLRSLADELNKECNTDLFQVANINRTNFVRFADRLLDFEDVTFDSPKTRKFLRQSRSQFGSF